MTVRARLIWANGDEVLETKVDRFIRFLESQGLNVLDVKNYEALVCHPEYDDVLELCYAVVVYSDVHFADNEGTRHVM